MKKLFIILIALISVKLNAQVATATLQSQQLAMETQIRDAVKTNSAIAVTGVVTTSSSVSAATLTSTLVTTSGTITAGAKSITILFSSDFTGSFNGTTSPTSSFDLAGTTISICMPNATQPAIPFTITTGNIYYIKE